jgi:hypothetical protein
MIISTTKPLLAWEEPIAISTPAPDFGIHVDIHAAERVQPILRERIVRDFAVDTGLSLIVAAICGVLIAFTESGNFWHGFGLVLAVRVILKLAFKASGTLEAWLDIPAFKSGCLEIYPDRIRWVESNKKEHIWPASTIRQIRLKHINHKRGVRHVMMVRFTRKKSYQILVPQDVSYDSIELAANTANIPVSRPKS